MTRHLLMVILLVSSRTVMSSTPLPATLEELACGADHIFTARVVEVDMVDKQGEIVAQPDAMTGPGLGNTIRLKLEVVKMHDSDRKETPASVRVPLDNFMHYSLSSVREAHADRTEEYLVFLQGYNYLPVIEGRFLWDIQDLEKAMKIRRECEYRQEGVKPTE